MKIIMALKLIKEIKNELNSMCLSLLLLKNGRIALSSNIGTIKLYNPLNDYYCEQVLERHIHPIYYRSTHSYFVHQIISIWFKWWDTYFMEYNKISMYKCDYWS